MHNAVYNQFQGIKLWVAYKPVELDGIWLDVGYISITTQGCENIPDISGSDMVYRLYYDNPPKVQSHTKIMHGKIPMTQIYGTAERHTYARNKYPSPSDSIHGNALQWRLNGGN